LAALGGPVVARELDEVDLVRKRKRAGEVGEEDEAGLEQSDEQEVALGVVLGDLRAQLADPRAQLRRAEENLADVGGLPVYDARSNRYRRARRSMSRL
jgi:hypothetical protein